MQLYCGEDIAIGPGKAALLRAVAETGSISAAARSLGMSYRRAWLLVDTMNRCFAEPLVETRAGTGAQVSEAGKAALAAYEALHSAAEQAVSGETLAALEAMLKG